jgi:hypothetical protein
MRPARRLIRQSRGQPRCHPFVELLGEDGGGMPRQPDILPRAPNMVSQPDGHCRGAHHAPLAPALVRPHNVGEADEEPDLAPMASTAPRQTPRAPPQGGDQPTPGARPPFHTGRRERRPELP